MITATSMIVTRVRKERSVWSAAQVTSPARFKDLCLDARDHQTLADWWCAATLTCAWVLLPDAEAVRSRKTGVHAWLAACTGYQCCDQGAEQRCDLHDHGAGNRRRE